MKKTKGQFYAYMFLIALSGVMIVMGCIGMATQTNVYTSYVVYKVFGFLFAGAGCILYITTFIQMDIYWNAQR